MRLLRQCADISLAELFMREMRFRIPGFRVLSQVIHAECAGILYGEKKISDYVQKDEVIAFIYPDTQGKDASGQEKKDGAFAVRATISGILRGLIRDGYPVTKGFKIADIDPRESEYENCFTISDKARCIAGGVLEALLHAGILPE